MSNRLTFSLASLFLIFALAFSATPVFAQAAVTATEFTSTGPYKVGGTVTVKVTYDASVTVTAATDDDKPGISISELTDGLALYKSGSPGTMLTFEGTIASDASDNESGLTIATSALSLRGNGTINDTDDDTQASGLTLIAVAASTTQIVDVTAPTLDGWPTVLSREASEPIVYDLTFSENVTIGANAFQVIGGGGQVAVTGFRTAHVLTITPPTDSEAPITVRLDSTKITDQAGNTPTESTASVALAPTHTVLEVDTKAPVLMIGDAKKDPVKMIGDFVFDVTSTEDFMGLAADDFKITPDNFTVAVAGSAKKYTATMTAKTGKAGFEGSVTVEIKANAAMDAAGNMTAVQSKSYTLQLDQADPVVVVTAKKPSDDSDVGSAAYSGDFYLLIEVTDDNMVEAAPYGISVLGAPGEREAQYSLGSPMPVRLNPGSYEVAVDVTDNVDQDEQDVRFIVTVTDGAVAKNSETMTEIVTLAKRTPDPTAPGMPGGIMATVSADKSSITVSWTAPTDTGGAALTGYTVTKSYNMADGTAATPVEKMVAADAASLEATFGSAEMPLTRDTEFTFSVVATNAATPPLSSAAAMTKVTISSDPTAPGMPGDVEATVSADKSSITVSFTAPTNTGNSTITGYTVTKSYNMADGTAATPVEKMVAADAASLEATFGSAEMPLARDIEFSFTVVATNAANLSSEPTTAVKQTIPSESMPDTTPPTVMVAAPEMPNADGDLEFTITFSEQLDSGIAGFTVADITVMGVDGVDDGMNPPATALTGPANTTDAAQEDDVYTLTLTPAADASVTVTVGTQIQDTAEPPNVLDATNSTLSATYDRTPPTVRITAPAAPDTDGNLTFTFDFSEEIQPDTITLDRSGSDNVRLGEDSAPMVDAADNTIYTILVTPANPAVNTTVLLLQGSVKDLAGNGLAADADATYMVPGPSNTAPVFEPWTAPNLTWCEGEMKDSILLPKARDTEGDELTYSLSPALPENPPTAPAAGLYWVTIDAETRHLRGTAQTTDAGTYTWTVMDEHGLTNVKPLTFTIVVNPYKVPNAVTGVMATKVDATATRGDDVDRVKLTWTDSNPTAYPNADCIPMVTDYIISRQALNSHSQGRTPNGAAVTTTVAVKDATMTDGSLAYTTDELAHGTYEFTVTAVNLKGNSAASDKAIWDRTMYHWVIVNDPPVASTNLRANQTEQPAHSVTLDWIPPSHNPDAPVNDGETGLAMKLYGVATTFGGYHVEVTDQSDGTITIYPKDDTLIDGDQRTHHITGLAVGEYTARVVAHNVVGEGALSNSQDFEIDVYQPGTPDPTNRAPVFADGASVENIEAKVGVRVPGRFLPEATDADNDDLTYSIDPALPAGLDFDEDTRALTGTPTAAMNETAYTYTVDDGNDGEDTLGFFITVEAATAGPPPTSTPTTTLDANDFIVYVRDIDNAPHFGTSNPKVAEWSAMPNLYELFADGGGGSLQLNVTGVNARQVVFSEVMWAIDEGKVGQDSNSGNQWIELRNRTATAIPISSISFVVKADGRPALAQGTDLISNVVGGGSGNWIATKGQNGNSGAADGSGQKEFISMYRKRFHNDSAGWNKDEWLAATQVYHPNHKGTPGRGEPQGPSTFAETSIPLTTVFNEISNSSNSSHEWIELRIREGDPHFENWVVDMVTGASDRDAATNPTQTRLFKLPKLDVGRFDKILLITKTDPARDDSHPLRGGYNVRVNPADQANEGRDENIKYYVATDWTTDLPDSGEFVLILRHGADKTNHEKVQDIAGYHPNLKVDRANFFSNLWPLRGYPAPDIALNKIEVNKVHRRQKDNIAGTRTADKKDNADHVALRDVGWTGIGYKRNADAGAPNGGTPGYPNNALASNETEASGDPVIISEIMYATGDRGNIPQWIELRNTSQTVGVNLDGWRITIVNHDQDDAAGTTYPGDLVKSYNINGKIPPGQTFLIVAHSGTDNTNLPSERIVPIRTRRGDLILSQYGFEITLETKGKDNNDANRKEADKIGNLAAATEGARVRGNPQSYETPAWMLPAGTNEDGDRISIVRVSGRTDLLNGLEQEAWRSFDMSAHLTAPESTYYGNRNDLASPGYTVDGVLPVSLSKFRPERLDSGEVVVRWVTESETNNAGFNILRGEALDGEFTKLNTKLIAGKGTTSERNTYDFVDESAKPNVKYYYQIQDVSLDGDVQTLRITHLRGNVSAAGKLTTTWGELKALQ